MSKSLLHTWKSSIEKNKNNTIELYKIAKDIFDTAYSIGKMSGKYRMAEALRKYPQWIPIKTRPMNDEEKKKTNEYFGVPYEDLEWPDAWHYDCRLPEVKDDGCVDVLVTTKEGYVVVTSYSKDCFGSASFENVEYPDDITAWAYMPKPYKEEGGSDADS